MNNKTILAAVLLSCAALASGMRPAVAVEYNRVISEKSAIKFIYRQMNVPMEGNFGRYASQLRFDPARPASAAASFQIDLNTIDTGATDADEEVRGKLWFNTKSYPQASFVSTSVAPLGGNRFEVRGKLTMKGKTQDVVAPISFTQDGANALFEGAFTIKRADFAIGEGQWADFGTVANEVQIKIRLLASASGK